MNFVCCKDFFEFAEQAPAIWCQLNGSSLMYSTGRIAEIFAVDLNPDPDDDYIWLSVTGHNTRYSQWSFEGGAGFHSVSLPDTLFQTFCAWKAEEPAREAEKAKREARLAEEAAAREARLAPFRDLLNKYNVPGEFVNEDDPDNSPVVVILQKLEDSVALSVSDRFFLKTNKLFKVLATCYYKRYKRGDEMALSSASSWLRRAAMPEEAIRIISKHLASIVNITAKAAVFTTQGGAHRDMGALSEAGKCAQEAIRLEPEKRHPYNLLGAVCYQAGNPEDGDRFFAKAIKLGATAEAIEREREKAERLATPEAKTKIKQYWEKQKRL